MPTFAADFFQANMSRLYCILISFLITLSLSAQTGPLTTTRHGYQRPYNRFCPYYLYDWGEWSPTRTQAGCVAAALEQTMTYYRRPVVVLDTIPGWTTKHYTIDTIPPGETLMTADILDSYTEEDDSATTHNVARLMYVLAVSAKMNFGLESSGASLRRMVEPMQRIFGYKYVRYVDSYDYTAPDWRAMLRHEIDEGRPVAYAAYTQHMGGHAFVIDGYDDNDLFHVNWGYNGSYNGWYRLDWLSYAEPVDEPTEDGQNVGFFCNHQALLLCPDSVADELPAVYPKKGDEIRIDQVVFEDEPLTERYTPVRITVTNTTDAELTTPMEFFTSLPTDTALFEQGDYNGLTGVTLLPGETRDVRMNLQFDVDGERIFHASPDDSTLLCAVPISIGTAPAAEISYGEPVLTFPEAGMVQIVQPFSVGIDGGRAGTDVTYEIYDADDATASYPSHYYHLYAHPGSTVADTVTFKNLEPGHTYSYRLRHPWEIRREVAFTVPADTLTGVAVPIVRPKDTDACYDLQGRAASHKDMPGVYISRGKKLLRR